MAHARTAWHGSRGRRPRERRGGALSPPEPGPAKPVCSAEEARICVGTALSVIELAAQVLHELPPVDAALRLGDRTLFRYLQAAKTAACWLVGQEAGDSVERPGRSSALGDGERIYAWSEEETERHFQSALNDWRERP